MAPLILNFGSGGGEQLHAATALPREKNPVPLRQMPSCIGTLWTGGDWLISEAMAERLLTAETAVGARVETLVNSTLSTIYSRWLERGWNPGLPP
jgi:hypothetical protein